MDQQIKGGKHDSISKKNVGFDNENIFLQVKSAFFDINNWDKLFHSATTFQLTDSLGNHKYANPTSGDKVKIKIPGPKNKTGAGYDWVKILEVNEKKDEKSSEFSIVVSPCSKDKTGETAHFFQEKAKNYFIIRRYENYIVAEVHGRNEIPNYGNMGLWDKARNFFVSHGGIFGFSKVQWQTWCDNILDDTNLKEFS